MILMEGKPVADNVREKIKDQLDQYKEYPSPHLAAILIGNDGASETYVASKIRNCEAVGFRSSLKRLSSDTSEGELLEILQNLNDDYDVDGILVQLPLPAHISEKKVIQLINPEKDVDGFHPVSAGNLMLGSPTFVPATPAGIVLLMKHYNIETEGKHVVVIGRSNIVGRPVSVLLNSNVSEGNATVTVCHSKTKNLKEICLSADIIVAALGRPGFLKGDMVKPGSVVIDVGITRVEDSSKKSGFAIKGDVDFDDVAEKCSHITPVPGGVGLMTIAALLSNTFKAWKMRRNIN